MEEQSVNRQSIRFFSATFATFIHNYFSLRYVAVSQWFYFIAIFPQGFFDDATSAVKKFNKN